MPGTSKGRSRVLSTACAECKRLKLKCSKTLPCSACTRRGCESICPDGQLKAGKGTRFILSDTQELHEEIYRLKSHIKELEETVAVLREHQIPERIETRRTSTAVHAKRMTVEEEEAFVDTFGSLTLKPDGSSEWYGRHGSSEYLMGPGRAPQSDTEELLPLDLMFRSKMFPLKSSTDVDNKIRAKVREYLPPPAESWKIVEDHYEYTTWSETPFTWEELVKNFLEPAYNGTAKDEQVAFLFVLLAIGTSQDHMKQPDDPVARRYAQLARISLMLGEDLLCSKSLVVISCLHGLAAWYQISLDPAGASKAWMLTAMAVRMAQAAGLHRDSDRLNSYPIEAERRRRIWWELCLFEYVQSITMARPRCIIDSQCDCKMPEDPEDRGGKPNFSRRKYRWFSECLLPIMDEVYSIKPPPYSTIIKHDHRLRDYPMPDFHARGGNSRRPPRGAALIGAVLQLFSTDALRELSLLYIHRTYLVEALSRWPEDPVHSRFGLSVVAVHRSSLIILQSFHRIREHLVNAFPRILGLWLHCVSAYICLCAIVIRSPGCSLALSSMVEIENTRREFDQIVLETLLPKFDSVKHTKHIVNALYEQAIAAYNAFQGGKWPLETRGQNSNQIDLDVLHLAGASNIFSQRREGSTADYTPGSTPSDTGSSPVIPQDTIHPALLQYMQVIQGGDVKTQGHSDVLDTDSSRNTMLSGDSSSEYGLGASTSGPVPHGRPGAACTNIGVPPAQPLPQVPADSQLWNSLQLTQYPSVQRNPSEATYPLDSFPDFDSIFRFQVPSLHTQYPQSSFTIPPTADHSQASNDLSRGSGSSGMRMGDTRPGNELDFASFMAENIPGLNYDGMGLGLETFFTDWNP